MAGHEVWLPYREDLAELQQALEFSCVQTEWLSAGTAHTRVVVSLSRVATRLAILTISGYLRHHLPSTNAETSGETITSSSLFQPLTARRVFLW